LPHPRPLRSQSDSQREKPSPLDPERMPVRRQSGGDGLLRHAVQVVTEQESDRGYTHRRPVAERSAGENRLRKLLPVAALGHAFEDSPCPLPVAALGFVIGGESLGEGVLANFPVADERLGHPDHHLRVVRVAEDFRGRSAEEFADRPGVPEDVIGRHSLEGRAQGIADGLSEQATKKPVLGDWPMCRLQVLTSAPSASGRVRRVPRRHLVFL
jgi:hypothetical protein